MKPAESPFEIVRELLDYDPLLAIRLYLELERIQCEIELTKLKVERAELDRYDSGGRLWRAKCKRMRLDFERSKLLRDVVKATTQATNGLPKPFVFTREVRGLTPELSAKLHELGSSEQDRASAQSAFLVELVRLVVPREIDNEQLGDELEFIELRKKQGMHPWRRQWMTIKCCGWAIFYTLKELVAPGAVLTALYKYLSGS